MHLLIYSKFDIFSWENITSILETPQYIESHQEQIL